MKCHKVRHKSYFAAIKHINSLGSGSAYFCASCNAYHVTSKTSGNNKFLKFKTK